jgi:ectoine hydroxylase-related dioxygenase (phytanoyl-CoA dioxygenase family)
MLSDRILDVDALVEGFSSVGAVVARSLFSPEEIALVAEGIDANLADPSPRAAVASRNNDRGRFFEDFCNWTRISQYEAFIRTSPAAELAQRLMKAKMVRFYHDHLLVKEPGTRQPTPWHQDQPYYNIEGAQTCSMWMPVDPVPVEFSLRFVAGSHLGPWLMPRSFMDQENRWFPEGTLQELPDVDGHPERYRVVSWALEPGDAIFFHMLALHSATGSASRRRVLSLRFMGDDVVHAPRPWATSPEFPGLKAELAPGQPMEHPLFPVVWPRPS